MATQSRSRRAPRLSQERRITCIIAAARRVIDAKGYETVSMAEIAVEAGIVEGTIYRYFENRQDLLTRVAKEWLEEQFGPDPALPAIRGSWNRLRHLIWRALHVIRTAPALSRFVTTELRPSAQYRQSPFFELNRHFTGEVRSFFQDAIESGEFRDDVSPTLLRDLVFGGIEHQTWAFVRGEGDFDIDVVADQIATVIHRGMLRVPAAEDGLAHAISRLEAVADRLASGA